MYLRVFRCGLCVLFCHLGGSGVHDRFGVLAVPLLEIFLGFLHTFDVLLFGFSLGF